MADIPEGTGAPDADSDSEPGADVDTGLGRGRRDALAHHPSVGRERSRTPWVRSVEPDGEAAYAAALRPVSGTARVDSRTKSLVRRLLPGDIAFIDHVDLDPLAAQALVGARVAAVVNAAASISGRYPNVGPLVLAAAGVPLVDGIGSATLEAVNEGEEVTVVDGEIWSAGVVIGRGTRQSLVALDQDLERARRSMGVELERFAENTLEHLRSEAHLLTDSPALPPLKVRMAGRHVLVVVRGNGSEDDLAALRAYIREMRPVLVGVDGGADLLVDHGYRADLIIGDFDSVSDEAMRSGAQLVVHAYTSGEAPGAERLEALGLPYERFEAPGTSEDVALLLAYEEGAELIVAVGTHASMVEFLDKGRAGMASTFLVRLKVGPILVDAKGVSRLYEGRVRKADMAFLIGAALLVMLVMAAVAPPAHVFLRALWFIVTDAWDALTGR